MTGIELMNNNVLTLLKVLMIVPARFNRFIRCLISLLNSQWKHIKQGMKEMIFKDFLASAIASIKTDRIVSFLKIKIKRKTVQQTGREKESSETCQKHVLYVRDENI